MGYFDSFSSPEDMAKYAEVFKKQRDVEAVEEKGQGNRNNWVGLLLGIMLHLGLCENRSASRSVAMPM